MTELVGRVGKINKYVLYLFCSFWFKYFAKVFNVDLILFDGFYFWSLKSSLDASFHRSLGPLSQMVPKFTKVFNWATASQHRAKLYYYILWGSQKTIFRFFIWFGLNILPLNRLHSILICPLTWFWDQPLFPRCCLSSLIYGWPVGLISSGRKNPWLWTKYKSPSRVTLFWGQCLVEEVSGPRTSQR